MSFIPLARYELLTDNEDYAILDYDLEVWLTDEMGRTWGTIEEVLQFSPNEEFSFKYDFFRNEGDTSLSLDTYNDYLNSCEHIRRIGFFNDIAKIPTLFPELFV